MFLCRFLKKIIFTAMRNVARFLFWITRWDIAPNFPEGVKKAVLVHAPHTSNWDFVIGMLAFKIYGVNARFLVKKEAFKFPIGGMMKRMGAMPVDREKRSNIIGYAAELIRDNEEMMILFTPEGTRSYAPEWKTGFHRLALKADVPIIITFIDYEKKIGGFGPAFEKTEDAEKDVERLKEYYRGVNGKVPEHGVR